MAGVLRIGTSQIQEPNRQCRAGYTVSVGSAAAISSAGNDATLHDAALTDLDGGWPLEQPCREKIGCSNGPCRRAQGALPDRCHAPSLVEESRANQAVASDVCLELRMPELRP